MDEKHGGEESGEEKLGAWVAIYESVLNDVPQFEVLSHRSWSGVYFQNAWLVDRTS